MSRGSAYEMAVEAERTGTAIDPAVLEKAKQQGFTGTVSTTPASRPRQVATDAVKPIQQPVESEATAKRPFVSISTETPIVRSSSGFQNPFVASAASGGEGGMQFDMNESNAKRPFASIESKPVSYVENMRNWFRDAPLLGSVYAAGKSVPVEVVQEFDSTIKSTPVLESVRRGGGVFEMKMDSSPDYDKAAAAITGNIDQKTLITYGAGTFLGDVGTGYETVIETPIRTAVAPFGVVGGFVSGVVGTPRMVADIGQSVLIGGETLLRNSKDIPGIATAGVAMQMQGTYDMATENPAELAGSIVGMYIFSAGVRAVGGRAVGIFRTRGQQYVPIENIGYSPSGRYPLNPSQEGSLLARSFAEGKLYPAPKSMAEGGPVPYLHGEGNIPVARLPNAQPGDVTLWTALESSSRARSVPVGEAYRLATSGGSEVHGMYGAPIAETHFTKVGSGKPQMIGFDTPFKTPTIYSTVTQGVEAVPKGVRGVSAKTNWGMVNEYVQMRSAEVRSGQAFMPLAKAEYEAIIPDNAVIEITGRNYYTRLGGFGKEHTFGTRVPIVEQRSIGFEPNPITAVKSVARESYNYMSRKPIISGTNLISGSVASNPSLMRRNPSVNMSGGTRETNPTNLEAYRHGGISEMEQGVSSRIPRTSQSYSKPSMILSKAESILVSKASSGFGSSVSPVSDVLIYKYGGSGSPQPEPESGYGSENIPPYYPPYTGNNPPIFPSIGGFPTASESREAVPHANLHWKNINILGADRFMKKIKQTPMKIFNMRNLPRF